MTPTKFKSFLRLFLISILVLIMISANAQNRTIVTPTGEKIRAVKYQKFAYYKRLKKAGKKCHWFHNQPIHRATVRMYKRASNK